MCYVSSVYSGLKLVKCRHVMASGRTVRQVKHGEKLRRSQNSLNPISSPESTVQHGKEAKLLKLGESQSNIGVLGFFYQYFLWLESVSIL